jgi:hypothetical protein
LSVEVVLLLGRADAAVGIAASFLDAWGWGGASNVNVEGGLKVPSMVATGTDGLDLALSFPSPEGVDGDAEFFGDVCGS